MIQEEVDKKIEEKIKASQFESEGELKANEFSKIAIQHQNKLNEDIFKEKLDRGLDPRTNLPMVDANGSPLPTNTKLEKTSEAERKEMNIINSIQKRGEIRLSDISLLEPDADIQVVGVGGKKYEIIQKGNKSQISVPKGDMLIRIIPKGYKKINDVYLHNDSPISKEEYYAARDAPMLASEYIQSLTDKNPLENSNNSSTVVKKAKYD